jgi:hypothetical protein
MRDAHPTITLSPRVGALLTQVTETPDLETALWRVLSEYITVKPDPNDVDVVLG